MLFLQFYLPFQLFAQAQLIFHNFFTQNNQTILKKMTLEQKIGQVLMFGLHGKDLNESLIDWMISGQLGNIKIFLRNVESQDQIKRLVKFINFLYDNSRHEIPPFIATDMEGGIVNHIRYKNIPLALSAAMIASIEINNEVNTSISARLIAATLKALGFNMNFAPCADVLTTPHNRVIRSRSYSSDPEVVAELCFQFITEMERAGILAVAKHFPGHGMSDFDSHSVIKSVDTSLQDMNIIHTFPYKYLLHKNSLPGCMTSHIIYSKADPEYPATFSQFIISDYLFNHLNFTGLVITDDLEMNGSMHYANDILTAFELAFNAGNHILLVGHTLSQQKKIIQEAKNLFHKNVLKISELDKKVDKILQAKKNYLKKFFFQSYRYESEDSLKWLKIENEKLAENGIVLLNKQIDLSLPAFFHQLQSEKKQILILSPTEKFSQLSRQYLPSCTIWNIHFFPSKKKNQQKISELKKRLLNYDLVIIGFANERQISWIKSCLENNKKIAILAIDNALMTRLYFHKTLFTATSFSYHPPAIDKLFLSVFKTGKFKGRLPYYFD